jgi:Flp pilus assembly pilin Flp
MRHVRIFAALASREFARLCQRARTLRADRRATTPVEYAMIAALSTMVIITAAVTSGVGFERPYNALMAQFTGPLGPNSHANTELTGAASVR